MKRSVCLFSVSVLLIAVIAVMSVAFFGADGSFSFWEAQGAGNTQTSSDYVYAMVGDSDSGTSGTVSSGSVDRGAYNPCLKYLDFTLRLNSSGTSEIELNNYNRSFSEDGILSFNATFSGTISDDSYVEVVGYRGNITSLYIPEKIKVNGKEVYVKAISGITSTSATSAITVIEIPSSVTSIDRGCFSGLKLEKLAFIGPCTQSLNIGARAFARSITSSTTVTVAGKTITSRKELPSTFDYSSSNAFAGWN